jgi:excisionase family DNA binding protein
MEKLLSIDEVSDLLGVPVSSLRQWRVRSLGPPAAKVGKHLRYSPSDVQRWLEDRKDAARQSPT